VRHGRFLMAASTGADIVHIYDAPRRAIDARILCGNRSVPPSGALCYSTRAGDGRRVCRTCARRYARMTRET
jgi:hypothetical protein